MLMTKISEADHRRRRGGSRPLGCSDCAGRAGRSRPSAPARARVSALGMADLMFIGQNISNNTARPIEVLTAVALIYFAIAFPLTRLVTRVEKGMLRKLDV